MSGSPTRRKYSLPPVPVWIQDPDDIPLQVLPVIVRRPIIFKSQQLAVVVIQEIDPLISYLLDQDRGAVQVKGRDRIPVLLGHPVPVFIISVGIALPAFRERRELPVVLPGKGCPIPPGERIPDLIIRDAFPVIGSQLVLPAGIPIGIVLHMAGAVYGFRHLIHQGRGRPVCIVQETVSGLVVCPQVHRPAAHAPKAIISVAQDLVPVKFFA